MDINEIVEKIKFNQDKLVSVIAQDYKTNEVLMLAYMNVEAFTKTIQTGVATYWSRSRQKLWVKGESSGNTQKFKSFSLDCDGDAILMKVLQKGDNGRSDHGAACHEGYRSCFFRELNNGHWQVEAERMFDPKEVY
ncbi:MAG: phosphoribosyl-AMP cyclohydrolase [bacterium]|nr:phosphoribosyl-AMP cyclohydrolase [bacterium]